jgi:hypothetical protein
MDHLLFSCPVAKVVWGVCSMLSSVHQAELLCSILSLDSISITRMADGVCARIGSHLLGNLERRNRTCFEKKPIKSPLDVFILWLCVFAILGRFVLGEDETDVHGGSGNTDLDSDKDREERRARWKKAY